MARQQVLVYLTVLDKIVYILEQGKIKAYIGGIPQNFIIVEKKIGKFRLSAIQL